MSSPWVPTLVCGALVSESAGLFSFVSFLRMLAVVASFRSPSAAFRRCSTLQFFNLFQLNLRRLKVHYRAPPDIRGSGKERGHGTELQYCPRCGKELKAGKHHVGCFAGRSAPRQAAKRFRLVRVFFVSCALASAPRVSRRSRRVLGVLWKKGKSSERRQDTARFFFSFPHRNKRKKPSLATSPLQPIRNGTWPRVSSSCDASLHY